MFLNPPKQLRRAVDLDRMVLTVGGIRNDKVVSLWEGVLFGLGVLLEAVAFSESWFGLGVLGLLCFGGWGYLHLSTAETEQFEVLLRPSSITFDGVELPLADIRNASVVKDLRGPILEIEVPGGMHRLFMQLEPMEHAVWLGQNLRKASLEAQLGGAGGSQADVPRALRDRRLPE